MPPLPNPRHEIIATQVATGKSWEESMLLAGYAKSTAHKQVQRMSGNVGIRARISELHAEVVSIAVWDAAKVLQRLGEIVDADIAEIYNENGHLKPLSEWPVYWRRLITRIETEQRFERSKDGGDKSWDPSAELMKVHMVDRLKALEMIGRHKAVDAFVKQGPDAKEVAGEILSEIDKRIAEGRQRAAEVRKIHATDK